MSKNLIKRVRTFDKSIRRCAIGFIAYSNAAMTDAAIERVEKSKTLWERKNFE